LCLSLVSSILRLKKVAMGYSSTGNPRRLSQRRSPLCGNYERFNNSNGQDELQKRMFSISSPRRVQRKLSLSGSTTAMEKMKNRKVLSISNPRKSHRRFSLSDSTTVIAKARFQNLRYAFEIHQLEKAIRDFVQYQISDQVSLKLRNLISEFKSLRHLYELGAVDERRLNETIVPKLTNDAHEMATILQQMGPDGMFEAFDEAPTCKYNGSGKPDFVVGLEKIIFYLKKILLQREVSVFGMQGMRCVGKTTMAIALCNHPEIKTHELEKAIRDFIQYQMPAELSLKLKNLISEFKSLRHLYDFGGVDERKVKLTNDPCEFAMMGQQMGSDDMVDVVFDEAPTYNYSGSGKPNFVVGLEKNIFNLKPILLQRKVSVFGIQHIGGVGKTTMAMALCNDQEIKGAFRNNIIYITYPLSPNLMKISETMWCFSKQYHFHPRPTVPKPEGNF